MTPLQSAVSVLRDIKKAFEEDDLAPGQVEFLLEQVNMVFDLPDVVLINIDFDMDEDEDTDEEDDNDDA